MFGVCLAYVSVSVFLPRLALVYGSFVRFATVIPKDIHWTLKIYQTAFHLGPIRKAFGTSLMLGLMTATCGLVLRGLPSWIIDRSRRTVTMPLLRPGLIAAWMLLLIASVRAVGTSVLLIGLRTKVIGPAIMQVSIVFAAMLVLLLVAGRSTRIEGE